MTRVPVVPTIAADVREYIAAEIALAGVTEVGFCCTWHPETKTITRAELVWRGSSNEIPCLHDDFRPGELELHSHPHRHEETWPLVPSKADLDGAVELAKCGIGSAIVDKTVDRLYVIREPIEPRMLRELATRPRSRTHSWSWWRFSLLYHMAPS
jgi:hypothetical protein